MPDLERVMNRKTVRGILRYYGYKGSRRVDEMFGAEKERGIGAFLGRLPLKAAVGAGMKKLGMSEEIKRDFLSKPHNRQTVMNIIRTVANNGVGQAFRSDGPLIIVWNYTSLCNLRCRYCYQSAGKSLDDELSFEERIDLINQMVDANVGFLAISGGEPVMGPRFWDVLEYAAKFLHISIATNGTLLEDRSIVDRLADSGAKSVFVSLDGASRESHEFIRGKGSFDRTIRGIRNLVANPHLHVGINTVVTQRNFDEVPGLLDLACELGVNSFSHYNFIPTGRGSDDRKNDLLPEQREGLLNMLARWHERRKRTKLNIISTSPQYCRVLYELSGGKRAGLFHYTVDTGSSIRGIIKYAGGCGAGRVYAAVQPNGIVSPCVFMPQIEIGDTRKDRLIDIWKGSDLCKALADREKYHFRCPNYHYVCGGCRARALAYGDILGADPGCSIYQETIHGIEQQERETQVQSA